MAAKRDYYEVLGLSRNADDEDIKRAYRRLARQYHPDVSTAEGTEQRFKEINEAYQVLSDPDKRAAYDRFGHAGLEGFGSGGFGQEGFPFPDIFDMFFGGQRAGGRPGPERGDDMRFQLTLTFEEAVFGCEKEITVPRLENCPRCRGSRAEPGSSPIRCPQCKGSGQVRRVRESIFGQFVTSMPCDRCGGEGTIIETPCRECHGRGQVQATSRLAVNVPAGVDDGTTIRLAGQGEAGHRGGPAGNLYVVIKVRPHEQFKRDGLNIILNLDINIAQAALGDLVEVPLPDGKKTTIAIPPGSQFGDTVILRDKGVPDLRSGRRGDEIVRLNVVIPKRLNEQQKKLLKDFAVEAGTPVQGNGDKGFLGSIKDALGV
jgi:molecular chaperone DnaJ